MNEIINEHLHFIPARDGDHVCIDVTRVNGWVFSFATFSTRHWNVSQEFDMKIFPPEGK